MKKYFGLLLVTVMVFAINITVFAAPKTMPDGTVFDAEFYAASNPDVVAAYGSSEAKLFEHYTKYGKKEGRSAALALPTATQPSAPQPVAAPNVNPAAALPIGTITNPAIQAIIPQIQNGINMAKVANRWWSYPDITFEREWDDNLESYVVSLLKAAGYTSVALGPYSVNNMKPAFRNDVTYSTHYYTASAKGKRPVTVGITRWSGGAPGLISINGNVSRNALNTISIWVE